MPDAVRDRFSETGEALMARLRQQRVSHNTLVTVEGYVGKMMREERALREALPALTLTVERLAAALERADLPIRHPEAADPSEEWVAEHWASWAIDAAAVILKALEETP